MGQLGGEVFVLLLIIGMIAGGLAGRVAEEKGYSFWAWFATGFFFNLFGLIATAGLPDKYLRKN